MSKREPYNHSLHNCSSLSVDICTKYHGFHYHFLPEEKSRCLKNYSLKQNHQASTSYISDIMHFSLTYIQEAAYNCKY